MTSFFSKIVKPWWLTGPIFDKELRVSSRRRRNYVLRFVYLLLLTVFLVMVWLASLEFQGNQPVTVYQTSQMSVAGMAIIGTIISFQFIATQLIAVIMLSTAISDEIYNRTLGVLMTTPINSFQIVVGKLFSKLLQLFLLLAISLPLLAVVRVFGGVPWLYVISSFCITLTAVIFAGLMSLYFSISNRRAYVVILKTVFTLGFLYGFVPAMVVVLFREIVPESVLVPFLMYGNPLGMMQLNTQMMLSPRAAGPMTFFSWPLHCAVMLAASGLILARSTMIVRRVALRQATGQLDLGGKRKRKKPESNPASVAKKHGGPIKHVKGSPIIWKELRAPIIQGAGGRNSIIGLIVTIIALQLTYAACIKENCLDADFTHIAYTLLFVIIGLIVNMVLSATSITSEKESRCWPILLATPLDDWHILLGKAFGVFRRCLPIWFLLAGHVVFFVLVGYIHPIAIIHLAIVVSWIIVFLSGSGLYFSALLKRTTSAVVANFAFAAALWLIVPALLGLVSQIRQNEKLLDRYMSANPVVQAGSVMSGAGGEYNANKSLSELSFEWPFRRHRIGRTTEIVLVTMLIYVLAGLLFAWRAKCRLRRNIF
ncbi:MAG: ABC transporter permease subunit [Planctomycetota bacterium]|jgi:ABC-type transport system involved in multi-copper enzyme maturation permease subunit